MTRWITAGIVVALAAFAVAGAACSSSNKTSSTKTPATRTPAKTTATKTTAATRTSQTPLAGTPGTTTSGTLGVTLTAAQSASLGEILTDSAGKTLYKYASDQPGTSNCTGTCAQNWPPLTTTGTPTAGAGVNGTVGTIQRSDGTTQVTFDGSPLYYFVGDNSAGDATGDGVGGFSVVNPM